MSKDWKEMERVTAKLLGTWWGCKFQRTPSSGAWSKNAQRGTVSAEFHGDIVAPARAKFPFSVECKSYEDIELYKTLYGEPEMFKWWSQCRDDARRAKKLPLLVMRENRKQQYLMAINKPTYEKFKPFLDTTPVAVMQITWTREIGGGQGAWVRRTMFILSLKDFLREVSPKRVRDILGC